MDSGCSWEQNTYTLTNELIKGMELTKQLKFNLGSSPSPSSSETQDLLLKRIISSYETALLILTWSSQEVPPQNLPTPTGLPPESSISANESPRSVDFDKEFKDQQENREVSKKRKMLPTWTDQVKISPENGLEGSIDDGFSWRKYGQKEILGANYPRSYYRCTYRGTHNCWATKQLQRSDEDPTVFEITYKGKHTCRQVNNSVSPPTSSEKQELNHNKHQLQGQQNEMLRNLKTNLRVNTENLDTEEEAFSFCSKLAITKGANQLMQNPTTTTDNHLDSNSPYFSSDHLSSSPFQVNGFGGSYNLQHSESDLTEIISANTSATNSPIVDWDFSIYHMNLDQNFPFDTQGSFT